MATFQAVILKGKVHQRRDGTRNIKIRITHKGKVAYISTDLYAKKFRSGQATGENALFINERIRDKISQYQKNYLRLGGISEHLTAKELKQRIVGNKDNDAIDFINFAEKYMENTSGGSQRAARGFVAALKRFRSTVYFSDINQNFLKEFEYFLIKEGNNPATYMSRFRLIFNRGRDYFNDEDRGIITISNYPFRKYRIPRSEIKTQENSLSLIQLQKFINYKSKTDREIIAKDVFLIMILLIGINTKDLFYLRETDIKNGRINYLRAKTGRKYSIKIENELLKFIEKYKSNTNNRIFNFQYADYLYFQKAINLGLKSICTQTDILPDKITSNWARHSWATIARNDCGINKDDIALCLGHKDTDNIITDIYIKYDYSIIDKSNRKVINLIFNF